MEDLPTAFAIETLFRDAYRILEDIQSAAELIEPIADTIASCHWIIQNLERVHRNQVRTHSPEVSQDTFDLRRNLDRFIGSCNALTYTLSPLSSADDVGCMFPTRPTWKRKQTRELQEEFWDHQRMLSLVLANAIYMTSLDMQKENKIPDSALATILRQAQKRHTIYERCDKSGQDNKSQRPTESRADQLEWELCVRRYFEYVGSRIDAKARSDPQYSQSGPLVRYAPEQNTPLAGPTQYPRRRASENFSYSSYRRGDDLEANSKPKMLKHRNSIEGDSYNAIYTRSRRNSATSNVSNSTTRSRTNSWSSTHELPHSPTSITTTVRSTTPGTEFRWENNSSGTGQGTDDVQRTADDTLERAWTDIMTAMQTMSTVEARAYIQGRLAGLDPRLTSQIRNSLGLDDTYQPNNEPLQAPLRHNSAPPTTRFGSSQALHEVTRSSETSASDVQRRSPVIPATTATAPAQQVARQSSSLKPLAPRIVPVTAQRRLPRKSSKNRLSSLRNEHQRQLSTIIERPSTGMSKKSESAKSRKSIFSLKKEKPPPLPENLQVPFDVRKPSAESLFSSDGSTLRGSTPERRIVELDEKPSSVDEHKSQKSRKSSIATSKPLPMTPGQLGMTTNPLKKKISQFFSSKKSRQGLPSSISTPQLASAMRSAETISKASLDCLSRRNGSKSTLCLVAIQEGPDQPFQVWLNALPYIEGRAGTPRV